MALRIVPRYNNFWTGCMNEWGMISLCRENDRIVRVLEVDLVTQRVETHQCMASTTDDWDSLVRLYESKGYVSFE